MESLVARRLQTVGMACFVTCFEDFQREAQGRTGRDVTKRAMFERGGAKTDNSAAAKAASGVWIVQQGLAKAALAAVRDSRRASSEVRENARDLLAAL